MNIQENVERLKKDVYSEIQDYYIAKFGLERGGIRFCKLFQLVNLIYVSWLRVGTKNPNASL